MDIPDPPELGPALIAWLRSFPFASSVKSWQDLQDGQVLWRVLQDVEPFFFEGDLPEKASAAPENWIPRWQNLKHVNRLVMAFIRDECGKLPELSKRMSPDLKAMAIEASGSESQKLTKAVLLAGLYSPESNQRMIAVLDKLGTKVGIAIAQCISQMEALDQKLQASAPPAVDSAPPTDTESDAERGASPEPGSMRRQRSQGKSRNRLREGALGRDPELEHEERLIRAYTRIKMLEEHSAGLVEDLEQARMESEKLEEDVKDLRYQLEHGGPGGIDDEAFENLRQRSNMDKDNIAQLEMELADARSEIESQEKQLDKLSRESEKTQKLEDDIALLQNERDDLRQASKANENLKKKIQTLQDSDKSNEATRQELAAAQKELQALRPLKQKIAALMKANEENAKTIQNGEQEIFDQKTTRRRLDHELRMLTRLAESAKERHKQDQELIKELEEKGRGLDVDGEGAAKSPETLDNEFAARDKTFSDMKTRNSQLENEVAKLREAQVQAIAQLNDDQDASMPDQTAYDLLRQRCEKLEKQYLDVYQENLGLSSAKESDPSDSQPFVEMRDRLSAETEKRSEAEKKLFDLESELTETKLKLANVDAKFNAAGKDKDEALNTMHEGASYEDKILHTENIRLLGHIRTAKADLEEHRSLLRHALLDKDALLREDEKERFENELKFITEQIRAVVDEPERTDDVASKLTKRVEDSRSQVIAMERQLAQERDEHETALAELKARSKRAEEEVAKGAKVGHVLEEVLERTETLKRQQTPDTANIQRELKLMTSAWYDMTRRIQSDAVVVQRRADAPRSFLNRQRKLLNSTVMPGKR